MKAIYVLPATAALVLCAFAQNPNGLRRATPSEIQAQFRARSVRMAHKPLVLSKGRILTAADKQQFIASAKLAFSKPGAVPTATGARAPRPAVTSSGSNTPTTTTLTVAQPSVGNVFMDVFSAAAWQTNVAELQMAAGPSSNIYFTLPSAPGALNVLVFQIYSWSPAQFTIANMNDSQTNETANVPAGVSEFAYAFDTTDTGVAIINVYSNQIWMFQSATVTTTPM